jgi:hypothetical protein
MRAPLLHFLLLGALLHALQPLLPLPAATDWNLQTVTVSAGELQRLQDDWTTETGRRPAPEQRQSIVQQHVDDEILVREALKLGLHETDTVVRRRLLANMRFAFPDSNEADDALLTQAWALGMHERDLVVRRRLVQLMQMQIASAANFSEIELRDFIARHPGRYGQPRRFAFSHLYFNVDQDPDQALRRARSVLEQLKAGGVTSDAGDPFLLGSEFSLRSEAGIARQFGPDFAQAVTQLKPGAWSGPVQSPYGLHLVRLEQTEAEQAPDYERISTRAAYAMLSEREREVLREAMVRLRLQYRVELPGEADTAGSETEAAP